MALVLACVAPAIVGAVLRSRAAERDMLDQVERRVNGTNRRFGTELDEYQANAKLALSLVEHGTKFQQALAAHDPAGAERMVKLLADVYKHRIILASDNQGVVLARGNVDRGPASLGPESSPAFADLLAGKPTRRHDRGAVQRRSGLRDGERRTGARRQRARSGPSRSSRRSPPAYLEYLEPKLNADLSLRVNEKVVAACADHPAPDLESHADTAVLKEVGSKLFALKTFRPEKLQRPDMEVEITASRDVTELRDETRKELYVQVGGLGLVLVVVLALALRFASRMGGAVRSISEAAAEGEDRQIRERAGDPHRRRARDAWPSTSTPWWRGSRSATGCARPSVAT